ncbi:MAG: hypothetical protein K5910_06995 [Bacteroidales bacterium]|nr:hypothetical protein [Bacteroidales bacterium]
MKYIIRSLKYFLYLIILLTLIVLILVLTGFVEADLSKIFVSGYDSLWQIAIIFFVMALIYPRFGFSERTVHLYGSPEEVRPDVVKAMERIGYVLETERPEDGSWSFRRRSGLSRALKMWEDRITVSPSGKGLVAEGLTRDLSRVVSAIEATRPEADA